MNCDVGVMLNEERNPCLTLLRNLGNYFTEVQLILCFAGGTGLSGRESMRPWQATDTAYICSQIQESVMAGMQGRVSELPWEMKP